MLKTTPSDVVEKLNTFINQHKDTQREFAALRSKMAGSMMDDVLANIKTVGEVKVISSALEGLDVNELRNMGDRIKDKFPCSVCVLASINDGKITFIAMATRSAARICTSWSTFCRHLLPLSAAWPLIITAAPPTMSSPKPRQRLLRKRAGWLSDA